MYPVRLKADDNGTVIAEFPDVPEAMTVGNDEAQAIERATDALLVALSGYMDRHRDIPRPSRARRGDRRIVLPPLAAAKLAIYQAMRVQGLSQVGLAKRLGCDDRQVRRLLDLDHRSRLDHLERALAILGKRLILQVKDAA